MKNENTTEVILLLDDSFTVPQNFYSEVRKQVTDIAPALQLDAEYPLKKLCDSDYWFSLTIHERKLAGRCMAYMVKNGFTPYNFAGRLCQSPKVYTVIR